jgi:Domain of unknown function (DUF4372)
MRYEPRPHGVCPIDRASNPQRVHKCVARHRGDRYAKNFSCWDQYLAMAFAQLTYRESLRDIETCLGAVGGKLYHLGFRTRVARSTLADANESRNQRGSGGGLENGCGGGCAELRGTHAPSGRRLACE